jgi:hypothetical protein
MQRDRPDTLTVDEDVVFLDTFSVADILDLPLVEL